MPTDTSERYIKLDGRSEAIDLDLVKKHPHSQAHLLNELEAQGKITKEEADALRKQSTRQTSPQLPGGE